MRAILLLVIVPLAWTMFWVVARMVFALRSSGKRGTETTVEGNWHEVGRPASPRKPAIGSPPCGRAFTHALLRALGAAEGCRRCAQLIESQLAAEHEAAVREAERQISARRDRP